MDTHPLHPAVSVTHRTELQSRATLALRLQSVRMLQMSERDVAAFIQSVESEPDFGKLIHPQDRSWKVIRFQPHPRTSLSPSFYQMNENTPLASGGSDAASVLVKGRGALGLIKKMGQELFEKYFLRADHEMDSFTLSHLLKIKESDIKKIRDFLLSYSVQTEFFDPSPDRKSVV